MKNRRLQMILTMLLSVVLMTGCGGSASTSQTAGGQGSEDDSLIIWYTQPELEAYFDEMTVAYEAETGTKVEAVQMAALDFIETVHDASVLDADYPDLYVGTTDQLEKAYLLGLTMNSAEDICSAANFPQKALDAVTYHGKKIAYPFYADTSVLVYNKNYAEEAPATIEEIQVFSETFEGDDGVQNIFVWNVNDIFVDFFTIGFYVELGGAHGDDKEKIVLNSDQIQECLTFYQELNQFFAIDKDVVSEEQIIKDFAEGKTIFAIIRDDSVHSLDAQLAEGVSYGIAQVPDLTGELQVRPLSITHSLVVNGYTRNPEAAHDLAKYLTFQGTNRLYDMTGNFATKKGVVFANPDVTEIHAQYEEAVEVPKVMEMSSYWLQMEPVFENVWVGGDVAEGMEAAQEVMDSALGKTGSEE